MVLIHDEYSSAFGQRGFGSRCERILPNDAQCEQSQACFVASPTSEDFKDVIWTGS